MEAAEQVYRQLLCYRSNQGRIVWVTCVQFFHDVTTESLGVFLLTYCLLLLEGRKVLTSFGQNNSKTCQDLCFWSMELFSLTTPELCVPS